MNIENFKVIIDIVLAVVAAIGGGAGIYFWRVNKDLKREEVKEKQADVEDKHQQTWSKQNDELQEYIKLLKEDKDELKRENKDKDSKMEEMRNTLNDVVRRVGVLEVQVERAESFRCDNLACTLRQPPLRCITRANEGDNDPKK